MGFKVIALEVDNVLWSGKLDPDRMRKQPKASPQVEDNLEVEDEHVLRDRNEHGHTIRLHSDVPSVLKNALEQGSKIAIVTSTPSRSLCERALWYFKASNTNGQVKPIINLVSYFEVGTGDYDSPSHSRESSVPDAVKDKAQALRKIQHWSQANFNEILLIDSYSASVIVRIVNPNLGLNWSTYQDATTPYNVPFYGLPPLGTFLGKGKFARVHDAANDSTAVVKILNYWVPQLRPRYLEIYHILKQGMPFKPSPNNSDDNYLLMVAFEVRNLSVVGQLKSPDPEHFTGWFAMKKIGGTPLYKTPLYQRHPFSEDFKRLLLIGCHLAVDEIESIVRKYGLEHRDGHLGNVNFTMQGDYPVKAQLLDWGIGALMKWDGKHYIRGNDVLVWLDGGSGVSYTPEEYVSFHLTLPA
ncbi:hypothetical protein ONZ45_g2927 [Pleurotus djamor]|nr:hypothetical protein ONZ45_g2927 [Pleurotus djamor]